MNKIALSFLAHPDDAEILCGGTLVRLKDAGWEVHIATCTPGDCGTMTQTPWQISSIRTSEAKASAEMLGATYHCLDERDLFVVFDKPTIQKAVDLFRRVAPTLVLTHAPKDYMMDHEQVSLLARAASFGYGAPNVSNFPLKAGSRVPYLYYCDPIEGKDALGREVAPQLCVDVSGVIDTKAAMLAAHASQREWLLKHHGMDEYVAAMEQWAAARGEACGAATAEGFRQHLGHSYPQDNLLGTLLGVVG